MVAVNLASETVKKSRKGYEAGLRVAKSGEALQSDAVSESVRRLGFSVVPTVLDHVEVTRVRSLIPEIETHKQLGVTVLGVNAFNNASDIILKIVANSLVLNSIEKLIGPFIQLDNISLIVQSPKSRAGIAWHRDPYGSVTQTSSYQRPLLLNLLIYLQDLTDESGPLRTIPGSHVQPLTMTSDERAKPHPDEVLLRPGAGDALLIHNNLVHSRSANRSTEDRIYISVLYNHTFMRQHLPLNNTLLSSIKEACRSVGDRRLIRLFDCEDSSDDRYNCGFMTLDEDRWRQWIEEESRDRYR